jgi:threonine synthase
VSFINCSNCRRNYPSNGVPYRCQNCGGVFDIQEFCAYRPDLLAHASDGIWKYRHTFGLPDASPIISLGEGNTPLVWADVKGKRIGFKCEYLNPTGSFKDRGSALMSSFLVSRSVENAIEDSSGNAGASFAAYAARAGIKASIYIPCSASGPKRVQIERYGAEVVGISGSRQHVADVIRAIADTGIVYASHAYLPMNLPGYATLAYELFEQLGAPPGTILLPLGQGGLFIGLARGFQNLIKSGVVNKIPKIVGIQASACAPIWAIHRYGATVINLIGEAESVAQGIQVRYPIRGDTVLKLCTMLGAEILAVEEDLILPGRDQLAQLGFYVEPTSSVVWSPLVDQLEKWDDPIVVVLTGNGLKT